MRRSHRITMVLALALAAGCPGHEDLHAAQHSVYDAEFAIVYTETMGAVQKLYPNFQEDAARGIIQTAWHQVPYAASGGDDAATHGTNFGNPMGYGNPTANPVAGNGPGGMPTTSNGVTMTKRYFVRFDVTVVGGRPWRVHVVGHASEWEPGNAVPTELRGANTPHWLGGRIEELEIAIYQRLRGYAVPAKEIDTAPVDDGPAVDVAIFGAIPPDAAKTAAAIVRAVGKRDYDAVRALVADDVVWSAGADPGIDAAMATWQADPSNFDALVATLSAGCTGDASGVTCPAKPGGKWTAKLALRGAAWKLVSFVAAE